MTTFRETKKTPSHDIEKFQDFDGSWMDYVYYLRSKGALSPNLENKYFGAPRLESKPKQIPYED